MYNIKCSKTENMLRFIKVKNFCSQRECAAIVHGTTMHIDCLTRTLDSTTKHQLLRPTNSNKPTNTHTHNEHSTATLNQIYMTYGNTSTAREQHLINLKKLNN